LCLWNIFKVFSCEKALSIFHFFRREKARINKYYWVKLKSASPLRACIFINYWKFKTIDLNLMLTITLLFLTDLSKSVKILLKVEFNQSHFKPVASNFIKSTWLILYLPIYLRYIRFKLPWNELKKFFSKNESQG